jgi:hypothetical protein
VALVIGTGRLIQDRQGLLVAAKLKKRAAKEEPCHGPFRLWRREGEILAKAIGSHIVEAVSVGFQGKDVGSACILLGPRRSMCYEACNPCGEK